MSSTKLNISKLELIHKHEWLESVVQHLKAIYCKKLKKGKAKMRMTFDFRGNKLDVSKTCSEKENTLPQRLGLLYAKFKDQHKDVLEEMKKDFYQKSGVPPLFQTDQQKFNNLKRQHGLLEDELEQTKKKVKFMEMSARNKKNQDQFRGLKSSNEHQKKRTKEDLFRNVDEILKNYGDDAVAEYCISRLHTETYDLERWIGRNVIDTMKVLKLVKNKQAQQEYSVLLASVCSSDVVTKGDRNGKLRKVADLIGITDRAPLYEAAKRRRAFINQGSLKRPKEFAKGDVAPKIPTTTTTTTT